MQRSRGERMRGWVDKGMGGWDQGLRIRGYEDRRL